MKKIYSLILLTLISFAGWGQILFHEPFNYTPDPVNGIHTLSSGVWLRLNTGDSFLLVPGNLSYPGCRRPLEIKFFSMVLVQILTGILQRNHWQNVCLFYIKYYLPLQSESPQADISQVLCSGERPQANFGATVWVRKSATPPKIQYWYCTRTTAPPSAGCPGYGYCSESSCCGIL
jgi:hypothetical protein